MLNENWSTHVKRCWAEWHSQSFAYFRELPIYHQYLAMLGLATSLRHLDALHEGLPPNVRLLRTEWVDLKSFWRRYFFLKGDNIKEIRQELIEWILVELASPWCEPHSLEESQGATAYYVNLIKRYGTPTPPIHFVGEQNGYPEYIDTRRVLSCPERSGYGDYHFEIKLLNRTLEVGFFVNKFAPEYLLFLFLVRQFDLTEKFTFQLMDRLPPYHIWTHAMVCGSFMSGTYLNFAFEFKLESLMDMLEAHGSDLIATERFLQTMAGGLRSHHIPVKGAISPIIMVNTHRGDKEESNHE